MSLHSILRADCPSSLALRKGWCSNLLFVTFFVADNVFVFEVQYGITDSLETKAFSIWNEIDINFCQNLHYKLYRNCCQEKVDYIYVLKSYSKANINSNRNILFFQVLHMSWVWERMKSTSHWNVWKRKFLTVKGSELQIFEMPPVSMFLTHRW